MNDFNLEIYKKETSVLIDVLFKLRKALTGTQINMRELNCKPLSCDILFKFTMNAITLSNILNGSKFITGVSTKTIKVKFYNIPSRFIIYVIKFFSRIIKKPNKLKFYDISSIFVLLRELLENYLTFNYLFINSKSSKDIDLKISLYKYRGLQRRQNYQLIPNNHQTIIKEKIELEKLKKRILNNPSKNNYDKIKNWEKFLESANKNKLFTWTEMIENSKLDTDYFVSLWALFSNYAHSEYISIIQIKDAYNNSDKSLLYEKTKVYESLLILLSLTIKEFVELFRDSLFSQYDSLDFSIKNIITYHCNQNSDLEKKVNFIREIYSKFNKEF